MKCAFVNTGWSVRIYSLRSNWIKVVKSKIKRSMWHESPCIGVKFWINSRRCKSLVHAKKMKKKTKTKTDLKWSKKLKSDWLMSAIKAPDVMTMCECCAAVYVFESPSCELEPVLTPLQKSKWSGFNDIFLIFLYFFLFHFTQRQLWRKAS